MYEDFFYLVLRQKWLVCLFILLLIQNGLTFSYVGAALILGFSVLAWLNMMGWGDVKLILILSCCLAPMELLSVFTTGSIIAGLYALSIYKKKRYVPFGACLCLALLIWEIVHFQEDKLWLSVATVITQII